MKNIVRGAAAALAAGAFALGVAAPAQADEASYLYDLEANGYTGDAGYYLGLGYGVCEGTRGGASQAVLTEAMYQSTGSSIDYNEAAFIVEAAQIFLC